MTKLEQALAKAKAGLVKTARKKLPLTKGQSLTFAGPFYGVVDARGKLSYYSIGDGPRQPAIYYNRKDAREAVSASTDRVVRIADLSGVVG